MQHGSCKEGSLTSVLPHLWIETAVPYLEKVSTVVNRHTFAMGSSLQNC